MNHGARVQPDSARGDRRRAFTLIELIAVVTLLLVVLGIAVPAFTNMIRASERTLAENTLRVGVTVARDIATLNGRDAGLLFVREDNGRTRLIPVIRVGTLDDAIFNPFPSGLDPASPEIERDVYVPVAFSSPLQMPRGWTISGYAEPGTIDALFTSNGSTVTEGWYDSLAYGDTGRNAIPPGSGNADPVRSAGHWVLPETAFFEQFLQGPGSQEIPTGFTSSVNSLIDQNRTPRQSFMLRFEATTGALQRGGRPALVLDPRSTSLGRGEFRQRTRWMRANRAEDYESWVNRIILTADLDEDEVSNSLLDRELRLKAIGNFSNDTVLAGAVSRLAVFEENELITGLGASGVNRETEWIYEPIAEAGRIDFDMSLFAGSTVIQTPQDVRLGITRWIQGDTNFLEAGGFDQSDTDGDGSVYGDPEGNFSPDAPVALIYFIHPGTGELTEVQR